MNRNLFSWAIYDFANSFVQVALGGLFLAQWVVLDKGFPDIWYGGSFALATVGVLITAPFWGSWSDQIGKRWPFVKWMTLVMIFLVGLLAIVAPSSFSVLPKVLLVLGISVVIQYLYQLSIIFYNALLEGVSSQQTRGIISGIGEGFSNAGWIIATAVLLLFIVKGPVLWGEPGRAQVFLPTFIFFSLLFFPTLLFFKERPVKRKIIRASFGTVFQKTATGIKELFIRNRNMAVFLVAFSFISDAIQTIQLYFAIIMDQLYHLNDSQKFQALVVMYVFMIIGGFILGKIGDRFGIKRVLLVSCVVLLIILAIAFLSSSLSVLYSLAVVGGVTWGSFYVTSRALLIRIAPPAQLGEYFGFYTVFQRFASIIGPLTWGMVTLVLRDMGAIKYQAAGFSLLVLMTVGIIFLIRVRDWSVTKHNANVAKYL